jgi:hypothetical protein
VDAVMHAIGTQNVLAVEGLGSRLDDITVYSALARIMLAEEVVVSNE